MQRHAMGPVIHEGPVSDLISGGNGLPSDCDHFLWNMENFSTRASSNVLNVGIICYPVIVALFVGGSAVVHLLLPRFMFPFNRTAQPWQSGSKVTHGSGFHKTFDFVSLTFVLDLPETKTKHLDGKLGLRNKINWVSTIAVQSKLILSSLL